MKIKKLFTGEVVQAILKRKEKLNPTVIIVSKLLESYDMSNYINLAEKLILAKEASEEFLKEHVTLDFTSGDIWLDETALHYYNDIITGYIDENQYMNLIEYVESQENLNRIHNQAIRLYREKSVKELLKTMKYHKRLKDSQPDEVKMINIWCLLELLSRTPLPKIYYSVKELPIKIKARYIIHNIKNHLLISYENQEV